MSTPNLANLPALMSIDVGEFISPDGRSHQFDGLMPLQFGPATTTEGTDTVQVSPTVAATATGPNYTPTPAATATSQDQGGGFSVFNLHMPQHFGARVAVGVIGVLLVVIVVAKFVLD